MPDLLADLRFALRRWMKHRTFAITASDYSARSASTG